MVADVLEPVESGMAYEAIIEVALRDWQRCDCRSSPHGSRPSMTLASLKVKKWNLNHCGAKINYLGEKLLA